VDPDTVRRTMSDMAAPLFVIASKSGSTIEPNVLALEARRRLEAAGRVPWGHSMVAITDPDTALHRRAEAEGVREVFLNPADIGGRYSALSLFGLVPAALLGIDVDGLLRRAARMIDACRIADPVSNPGLALGAFMAAAARAGRDKLTLRFESAFEPLGLWVEQLVAESTGKHGVGIVPIAGESPSIPLDRDRAVVALGRTLGAPDDDGVPRFVLQADGALALGAEFFRWEYATATAGYLLGINPFDEPNVQQAKDATRALLETCAAEGRLPFPTAPTGRHAELWMTSAARAAAGSEPRQLLRHVADGEYVALLAYLPSDDRQIEAVLTDVRLRLGMACRAATTLGFGPRYLHSTGQLHKGGPNTGVFVIVIAPPVEDLPIPGEPYSFGILEAAQALGDFQSLESTGRRAILVRAASREPEDLAAAFEKLVPA
jgi:hypothetical protein